MLASQVGAYQSSLSAFTQQANSGADQARVAGAQEAPPFPQTNFSVDTRKAVPATASTHKAPAKAANSEGRGKLVDILA
jgi:hypothetical protein